MTTKAQLRKAALSLPEVEESTNLGLPAFKVDGKGFASLTKDGYVQLSMSPGVAKQVLSRFAVAEMATRSGKPIGVRVPLADVNGMELNSLVEKSWLSRAPKKLAEARRGANRGEAPGDSGDLPKSIGKPATRALLGAGISSLDEVAARTEAELLDLHGVGPRAIRLMKEELAEQGMKFRAS